MPGVAITAGAETGTPVTEGNTSTGADRSSSVVSETCLFEKTGVRALCKPKSSLTRTKRVSPAALAAGVSFEPQKMAMVAKTKTKT